MSVNRNQRPHRPKGLPQGLAGTFDHTNTSSVDTDLTPPVYARKRQTSARSYEDDAQSYAYKDHIEQLAASGHLEEADRMARDAGAFLHGERLPYLDNVSAAYWDGHTLSTIDFHGYKITMRDSFDPASITLPN